MGLAEELGWIVYAVGSQSVLEQGKEGLELYSKQDEENRQEA